jgi:trigger factor
LALLEGCRHLLDITIPSAEVESETTRVAARVRSRAKLPGFRPGKAPDSLIRQQFAGEIRQQVLEALVPKFLDKRIAEENLDVAGTPDIKDVHFHEGEDLTFKAEFEVVPEIELKEYKGVEIPYQDPQVSDEDVAARVEELREQRAQFVNVDPRPLEDGDFAVVSLESISGVEGQPVKQEEMVLEIGGKDTFEAFTTNLRGTSPGDEKEFEVTYPADYGAERLAGRAVGFHAVVKGVRRKDVPALDDELAQELGDYRTLDELREAVRKALHSQREFEAQQVARDKILDVLVDTHEFPVPQAFIDRQIRSRVEQALRGMAAQGVDPSKLQLDWNKLKESQQEKAVREVKASLILGKVAARESIGVTREEVDKEVEKLARQQREPLAAVQMRFEKDGTLSRLASHLLTEKTLAFLFEHARKTAEA